MRSSSRLLLLLLLLFSVAAFAEAVDFDDDDDEMPPATPRELPTTTPGYRADMWALQRRFAFADVDGGVWKQGFPLRAATDPDRFADDRPRIYVVPWSHNDPGWRVTYAQYFSGQSSRILDSAIAALGAEPARRYLWSETCVLQRWFAGASEGDRSKLRRAVRAGQFEVATGGWVMTDEAGAHFEQMVVQLAEGHEWLARALGVAPRVAWSIDPFGHSPVMAYVLARSGFEGMVINRIHYALKRELAAHRATEFYWRPHWQRPEDGDPDEILAHVLPFFAYDIPHTCGPNARLCATYDFSVAGARTPWGDTVRPLTNENVHAMASALAEQYREKSALFRTPNVLVPLGYDFSYATTTELESQLNSYQRLFDIINADPNAGVAVAFANLSEWFSAVRDELPPGELPLNERAPIIRGDFFPYSDLRQDYWSGYFTSRPFYKQLSRVTHAATHAAESLLSLLSAFGVGPASVSDNAVHVAVQRARRTCGLFMHHDAITGTEAKAAVQDYGQMLHDARWDMKRGLCILAQHALALSSPLRSAAGYVLVDEVMRRHGELRERLSLMAPRPGSVVPIVLHNPLPHRRTEMVSLEVLSADVGVRDRDGRAIRSQLSPAFDAFGVPSTSKAILTFPAVLPPLAFVTVFLVEGGAAGSTAAEPCEVFNVAGSNKVRWLGGRSSAWDGDFDNKRLCINNGVAGACFDTAKGTIDALFNSRVGDEDFGFEEQFARYNPGKGGPYIFKPEPPTPNTSPLAVNGIVLLKGLYTEEVHTSFYRDSGIAYRVARVVRSRDAALSAAVELEYSVDVKINGEYAARFATEVEYHGKYVTDENGFAFMKRFWRPDMPIAANFFPVTSTLFWQDSRVRASVHVAQAVGASCQGANMATCEVMLDRRATADDGKGLSDRMDDNIPLKVPLRITLETPDNSKLADSPTVSLLSHVVATRINHPVQVLLGKEMPLEDWVEKFGVITEPLQTALPHDVEIVMLRSGLETAAGIGELALTLARHITSAHSNEDGKSECIDLAHLLRCGSIKQLSEHTLTFMRHRDEGSEDRLDEGIVCLRPGSLRSFSFNLVIPDSCPESALGNPTPGAWQDIDKELEPLEFADEEVHFQEDHKPLLHHRENEDGTWAPTDKPPEAARDEGDDFNDDNDEDDDDDDEDTAALKEWWDELHNGLDDDDNLDNAPEEDDEDDEFDGTLAELEDGVDEPKQAEGGRALPDLNEMTPEQLRAAKRAERRKKRLERLELLRKRRLGLIGTQQPTTTQTPTPTETPTATATEQQQQQPTQPLQQRPNIEPIVPPQPQKPQPQQQLLRVQTTVSNSTWKKTLVVFALMVLAVLGSLWGYQKKRLSASHVVYILTAVCCLNAFIVLFSSFA